MKNDQPKQDQPLRETAVSGSVLNKKLTAYKCYKLKQEKNLSDEEFKKLLVENRIILSAFGETKSIMESNMKSAVFGNLIRKGIEEVTKDCINVAVDYNNQIRDLDNKIIIDYIHEFAWEFGRLWNTELSYEDKMLRIGKKIKLPDDFLAGISETNG